MAQKRITKDSDIAGKILVCKGAVDKPLGKIALRWTFGDPSRHDEPSIDIEKGMRLRIGTDVSVVDARLLLQISDWKFSVVDDEADKDSLQDKKGDK